MYVMRNWGEGEIKFTAMLLADNEIKCDGIRMCSGGVVSIRFLCIDVYYTCRMK